MAGPEDTATLLVFDINGFEEFEELDAAAVEEDGDGVFTWDVVLVDRLKLHELASCVSCDARVEGIVEVITTVLPVQDA